MEKEQQQFNDLNESETGVFGLYLTLVIFIISASFFIETTLF